MNLRGRICQNVVIFCAASLVAHGAGNAGIETAWMDTSVRPQDDLFRYANGRWLQETPIPLDRPSYGVTELLEEKVERELRAIAERPENDEERKVARFFASFIDEQRPEAVGVKPLEGMLASISSIANTSALAESFARLAPINVNTPLVVGVGPDLRRPEVNAASVRQGGLGLPDREYYLREDGRFKDYREAYRAYITELFRLSGEGAPTEAARRVMAVEESLARIQWTAVESRDRLKTYNRIEVAELDRQFDGFAWSAWTKANDIPANGYVIVRQPTYVKAFASLVNAMPLGDWKLYLKAATLNTFAPYLNSRFAHEEFGFNQKTLNGVQEQRPRWKRAVGALNANLPWLTAETYVQRHFAVESRQRVEAMVDQMKLAFDQSIGESTWMTTATKAEARAKLSSFYPRIGFPRVWLRDYSQLEITPDDLVGNVIRANRFEAAYQRRNIGMPVNRDDWSMTPQRVSAQYSAGENAITFPAAFLQPPFFDPNADDAVNYGGAGAAIGHEMGHGFDDQGRRSDHTGKLRDWWTPEDEKKYLERANTVVAEFNRYEVLPGLHVNGNLTLGENLGDLGGLQIALRAYHLSLHGQPAPLIDGLTGDQRFFIAYAQSWLAKRRADSMRVRILSNPHAPEEFRTNGPVRRLPEFYAAFGVKPGDKMYLPPEERVTLW